MRQQNHIAKIVLSLGLFICLGLNMNAYAGMFGFGGDSWKEEVMLHDGRKIIVERTVQRGGRREVGQQPPIKEQRLTFTMPGTKQQVVWEDSFSQDIGTANFLPMLLGIHNAMPYLVAYPMGCLSYNKWGRPNPPYVVFKYDTNKWSRITLQELPQDIKTPNLIFSSPDVEAKNAGTSIVSAVAISGLYAGYRQPEFKTILRERTPKESECEKLEAYKGKWIRIGDPLAKQWVDSQQK